VGMGKPRTITIDIYNRWKPTGRQVILHDCVPAGSSQGAGGTMEEVTVKPIRVELK